MRRIAEWKWSIIGVLDSMYSCVYMWVNYMDRIDKSLIIGIF